MRDGVTPRGVEDGPVLVRGARQAHDRKRGGARSRERVAVIPREGARATAHAHPVGTCKDAGARESRGVTQAPEGICERQRPPMGRTSMGRTSKGHTYVQGTYVGVRADATLTRSQRGTRACARVDTTPCCVSLRHIKMPINASRAECGPESPSLPRQEASQQKSYVK